MKLIVLIVLCCASALAAAAQRPLLVAYYLATATPGRDLPADKIPANRITHLNYAFADVRDGEVAVGLPEVDLPRFAVLRRLKKQHPRLKTLIAVGGWEWSGGFSDAALTPASRTKFAASGVAFIREHGFDGIDLDWEFPVAGGQLGNVQRAQDKPNFTLLLRALREALDAAGLADGRRYLLSVAAGSTAAYIANTEIAAVADTLDWLNLMSYDMSGPWSKVAGHVAPLHHDPALAGPHVNPRHNVADAVDMFLAAGVPPHKLVLGVPFYGYYWKGCRPERDGQYQPCEGLGRGSWEAGALDYTDIETQFLGRDGFRRHWNAAAKVPFVHNPRSGEFITFEDARSLREKVRFLKQRGLGGAMFWQLGADRRHRLLDVLAGELNASGSRPAP